MPELDKIASFLDTNGMKAELQEVLQATKATTAEIIASFDKVRSVSMGLEGAKGVKDTVNGFNQLKTATDSLVASEQQLLQITARVQERVAKYNGHSKELTDQILKESKATTQVAAAREKEAKASLNAAKAKEVEARAVAKASQEKQKSLASSLREQKVAAELTNEYLQLSRAYNDAALKAKNYALTLGETHPVTIEAVKDAKAMYDVLYRIDQSVGQNFRNVGNYRSAFDGLGMSFAQVARELPSLTISAQQFFLAISNNLPFVFDEIKKARVEIAALRKEGQAAPSMLSRIGGALFGWQTLLSIGITLLVAYGKEIGDWVSSLFQASSKIDDAAIRQRNLNEAYKEGSKEVSQVVSDLTEMKNLIDLAKEGVVDKETALRVYNERLGETLGEVKSLNEAEQQLIDKSDAFIRVTFLKAAAHIAGAKAADEYVKILLKANESVEGIPETEGAIVIDVTKFDKNLSAYDKYLASLKSRGVKAAGEELRQRLASADAGQKTVEDMLDLQQSLFKRANEIAKQFKINIFGTGDDDETGAGARAKVEDEVEKLLTEKLRLRIQREADAAEKIVDNDKKSADERHKALLDFIQNSQTAIDLGAVLEIQTARRKRDALLTEKNITAEQQQQIERNYYAEISKINENAEGEKVKLAQETSKKLAAIREQNKIGEVQTAKVVEAAYMSGLKEFLKAAEDRDKARQDELKKEEDILNRKKELYKDLYDELTNTITAFVTRGLELEQNALQDQIDGIEERKAKEIEALSGLAISAQEKADRIKVIEANTAAERERLERRQRQLQVERARFEKASNIAGIIGNTAAAIMKQLAATPLPLGGPLIALIGAIGAAQLATAIATPIPRYKDGTDDHPGGLAVVGDGGKSEYVVTPDGRVTKTPSKDTLVSMPKGSMVFPDERSFIQAIHPTMAHNQTSGTEKLEAKMDTLIRTVKNKKVGHIHIERNNLKHWIQDGHHSNHFINQSGNYSW